MFGIVPNRDVPSSCPGTLPGVRQSSSLSGSGRDAKATQRQWECQSSLEFERVHGPTIQPDAYVSSHSNATPMPKFAIGIGHRNLTVCHAFQTPHTVHGKHRVFQTWSGTPCGRISMVCGASPPISAPLPSARATLRASRGKSKMSAIVQGYDREGHFVVFRTTLPRVECEDFSAYE